MSFDDDNDFGEDGSSDEEQNDQDDQGDDQDDGDGDDNDNDNDNDQDQDDDEDGDGDGDGDDDDDAEGGDGEDTEMQDLTQSSQPSGEKRAGTLTMPSQDSNDPLKLNPTQGQTSEDQTRSGSQEAKDQTTVVDHFEPRPEALTALTYDIAPTIAAPQSTSINCVTATPNMKYVLSGGSDGYIRKFNWPDTANGKLMLTVAQKHPFVDSVVKAGVLMSYWENDEGGGKPESMSPVYALAVNKHAVWLLSGLESGGINIQSVRHEEGKVIHRLKQHTSAVSVLQLSQDERSCLSGSWDKKVFDWDLDTGKVIRKFEGYAGQISAVEVRPESSLPVPKAEEPPRLANGTYSSNNDKKPVANGTTNGAPTVNGNQPGGGQPSPAPSNHSFSSLFGDDDNDNAMETNFGGAGGDEDNDLFGGAVTNDMRPGEEPTEDAAGDTAMVDAPAAAPTSTITSEPAVPAATAEVATSASNDKTNAPSTPHLANGSLPNGTPTQSGNPHSSEPMVPSTSATSNDPPPQSSSTFLSASIEGSIRIWDRRQSAPVVKLPSRFAPPWCMSAIWSPDGNSFYAGRRNGTVEEYSMHKPLAAPSRTFRFPSGSGPVSALKAMPNGRHLVCASFDILRLYDLQHEEKANAAVGKTPFLIVPGHRTGVVSALYLDPTCQFMISTAGNRGWEGTSTQVLLGYEIGI